MPENRPKLQEKSSKGKAVGSYTAPSVVHEMRDHVVTVARLHDEPSVKAMIAHAAKRLGITFGRAQNHYYGEVRRVEAQEADLIRSRAQTARLEGLEKQKRDYEAARREFLQTAPGALAAMVPPSLGHVESEALADRVATRAHGSADMTARAEGEGRDSPGTPKLNHWRFWKALSREAARRDGVPLEAELRRVGRGR